MPTDLQPRLAELDASLGEFDTKDTAPAQLAEIFNALLSEAQRQMPGDPVVTAMKPVEIGGEFALADCGAVRAVTQQLIVAVGD